jgi:hypothetical protein
LAGAKIFSVAVVLFGCDPCNEVKIPIWHQKKFLAFPTSNYQPFSHICCIADPFTIL